MNPQEVNAPPPSAIPPAPPGKPPRRSRWVGSLLALVLVGLVGGAAWYLIQRANGESSGGPGFPGGGRPMVTVGDAVVRKAELPVIIDALGTVIPATTVTLRPQVSGMLTQVLFTEGQMVKKGQLLAQIDPRPFEQALMQAQGTRQRDEAQLENARLTLERYRTLLSQDSIARQDVDTQAALVKQLEGTVMTDKAQEGTARLNLDYTRITAPASGRIGLRTVDAGNYVTSGDTAGLATLVLGQRGELIKLVEHLQDQALMSQVLCLRLAIILHHARVDLPPRMVSLQRVRGKIKLVINKRWAIEHPRTLHLLEEEVRRWGAQGRRQLDMSLVA